MSIRIIICAIVCLYFCLYAWKNCFVSACAAVLLMSIMQHPDVIESLKSIGGIQGLNLWNLLIANVVLAWFSQRAAADFQWDMPRDVQRLLGLYVIVILWSATRLLFNPPREFFTPGDVISEKIINCVKWIIPGLILFDTCRTRKRLITALIVVLALYFLLALQVIKHVPLSYAVADSSFQKFAYKLVQNSTGYNRVTLSMMLAGASWAIVAMLPLAEKRSHRIGILGCAAIVALGQALTGGRSGYFGWTVVGLILCVVKWRKLLPLIPMAIVCVFIFMPGIAGRVLQGIGVGGEATDTYEATSGRNIAWPYVIHKIKESPIIGFGCEAMISTGIYQQILEDTSGDEDFPHPHNAYLQVLLDMGIVGFAIIIPFFYIILKRSFKLLLDRSDPLFEIAGGICCAIILALLVASMGGQTFYPREGAVGMWATIGLMLRVWVERERAIEVGGIAFGEDETAEELAATEEAFDLDGRSLTA